MDKKNQSRGQFQDQKSIEVLFEDEWLVAVNKPSGLPTQQTLDPKRPHLFGEVKAQNGYKYLALHHRLDVGTSGVVIMAKHKGINKDLSNMFKNREFGKIYEFMAYSQSSPKNQWTIDNHLKKVSKPKAHMIETKSGGDRAITDFKILEQINSFLQVQATPKTGRMHQIRVHAQQSDLMMIGDRFYAYKSPIQHPRMLLHAKSLTFVHPKSQEEITIDSQLPWNFKTLVDELSNS